MAPHGNFPMSQAGNGHEAGDGDAGRARGTLPHIVVPAAYWPRGNVYYYDAAARAVFGLDKHAPPVSPLTGRNGCRDIFTEMAERLNRSWSFFEATRVEPGRWLFANSPGGPVGRPDDARALPTYPLAYYGELRALGFIPPWLDPDDPGMRRKEDAILREWVDELARLGVETEADFTIRNRVFMNEARWARPVADDAFWNVLGQYGVPADLRTRASARAFFDSLPWETDPYAACNFIGKALHMRMRARRACGEPPEDDVYDGVRQLIAGQFQPAPGCWGGRQADHITRTNGNMKMLATYAALDWEIPSPRKIVDFTLSGADEKTGFQGSGCSVFNQLFALAAIRRKYPELADYRGGEIDRCTAMTFMTWLANWDDEAGFYGKTWLAKHNHGVAMFMPMLLLDQPYMRGSTVYNWREGPIITRKPDGGIVLNPVIYQRKGYPFDGGG